MIEPPDEQERLAREWLALAEEDLLLSRELHQKSSHLRALCFHAQQAVEKFLKALLTHQHITFSRTHDIESLVNHLPGELSESFRLHQILDLTEYAVDTRYPSIASTEITRTDAERAFEAAQKVTDLVRRLIK